MKTLASVALALPLIGCTAVTNAPAEQIVAAPPIVANESVPVVPTGSSEFVVSQPAFTDEQLDLLLGPIALYPDALIALILPASTAPADIDAAGSYLRSVGDVSQVDLQPWDESVRALAHYPEIIKWMDSNLTWTTQLGQAFASQPTQVMNAVQRLRARARAAGTLVDTPQQRIVYQGSTIFIIPAQPDVIYVPYYDPAIVYAPHGYYSSPSVFFNFSPGFATGWWLSFGVDWQERCVWAINRSDRERFWREHRGDWQHHYEPPRHGTTWAAGVQPWRPHYASQPAPSSNYRPPHYTATPTRPTETPRNPPPRDWHPDGRTYNRSGEAPAQSTPPATDPIYRAMTPPVSAVAPMMPTTTTPVPPTPNDRNAHREWRGDHGRENTPNPRPPPAAAIPPTVDPGANGQPYYRSPSVPYGRGNVPPPAGNPPPPRYSPPSRAQPPPPPAPAASDQQPQTAAPQQQPPPQPQPSDDDDRRRPPSNRRGQPN